MPRSVWRGWLLWVLRLACGVLLGGVQPVPAQEVVALQSALATIHVDGVQTRYPVTLPYHWDRLQGGKQGWAEFALEVELAQPPTEPWALFMPRVGNVYEVWLNGALMQRAGDMQHFGGADMAKIPRYVPMPVGLHAGRNALLVRIRTDIGRKGGLAAPKLGPVDAVYPLYYQAYRARGTGSLVVMVISTLVGLVALTLWWTQVHADEAGHRQRDPMYLMAALGELAWAVRVGDTLVENPPLPWVGWNALMVAAGALWGVGMGLFCAHAAGWRPREKLPWVYPWSAVFVAAGAGSSLLALEGGYAFVLTAWYVLMFVLFGTFLTWYSYWAVREGSRHHQMMAAALAVNVAAGVYDLLALRVSGAYGTNSLLRFSSLLFGLALAYIVFQRFRAASVQVHELNRTLEARVAYKEQELARTYARMEELARQQERSGERSRILRDMHDGVGVHLSVALRQIQSGNSDPQAVAALLQEGLDQLKLSIDSLSLVPGDVTALLANLRYRLEPRLRAAGIGLQWLVDELPPVARLDDKGMRQLQFVVYEALSNVVQHAHASTITVQAHAVNGALRLSVADDGRGFDSAQVPQRGLGALRDRVQALGGTLRLHSEPGQTMVEVLLP